MKDKVLEGLIKREYEYQENTINLIPSENIVSDDVLEAVGSRLNKYTEGYPEGLGRYYNGCKYYDDIENLCRERILNLMNCKENYWANVQPHSGSNANFAVYEAMLELGDTVLSSDLTCYAHLTHGSKANASGRHYNFVHHKMTDDGFIDYDDMEIVAMETKPKMIIVGYSAYPRFIDFTRVRDICDKVGALMMCDVSHIIGLILAKGFPNPCNHGADIVTFTTHKTMRGSRHAIILCKKEYQKKIDKGVFPNTQGGALMNQIAGVCVALHEASQPSFRDYQCEVVSNARYMAHCFQELGYNVVTNGTDTHLVLIDLRGKTTLNGKEVADKLEEIGIIVNKNTVPNEVLPPSKCSGIRLGTPTITSRGMGLDEVWCIVNTIDDCIQNRKSTEVLKARMELLCKQFPIRG